MHVSLRHPLEAQEAELLASLATIENCAYVIDTRRLERNMRRIAAIREKTGCTILLALKAFAVFSLFARMRGYLQGVTASSLNEARLGREEFGGQIHLYAPAYVPGEFAELCELADYITFNSFEQNARFGPVLARAGRKIHAGIRINPGHSENTVPMYDSCAEHSRFGATTSEFHSHSMDGISGLHVHALCAQNADALERLVAKMEKTFPRQLEQVQWLNLGGGHLLAEDDYDSELLCSLVCGLKAKYGLDVILEPGEGAVHGAGYLVATVLEINFNGMPIAILDASAINHVPSLIEHFQPLDIVGGGSPGTYPWLCRLAGSTCLSGDLFGDYSFPEPLKPGDRIVVRDMAHYTMVRNTMFNGLRLPSVYAFSSEDGLQCLRTYEYSDYKGRLP
ncbi:MAG TPA: carboxynorspermidine decarboxylase [Candidatus Solibacter sp.]|jgi:carboxynorspermidine decarboxylase|nr:carboxynorspermidine decarboxylase [Candidatus Solibacter sp.]